MPELGAILELEAMLGGRAVLEPDTLLEARATLELCATEGVLETRGTLLVPCTLGTTAAVLEVGVETRIATDDVVSGEEETAGGVEDPAVGAALELAGIRPEELAITGLEELAGMTAEEV